MSDRLDISGAVPGRVAVSFAGRACGSDPSVAHPDYLKTVTAADAGHSFAGHPATYRVGSDALALYPAAGAPSNQANLDALALQIARDYYAWRTVGFDREYDGAFAASINGFIDEVIIDYSSGRLSTRLRSAPPLFGPSRLNHHDPAVTGCTSWTQPPGCVLLYTPGNSSSSTSFTSLLIAQFCVVDGRLKQTQVGNENTPCGCVTPAQCLFVITVYDVHGAKVGGATVTVTGPGGFSTSCVTAASGPGLGTCGVTFVTSGTYSFSVTVGGITGTYSGSFTCTDSNEIYDINLCAGGAYVCIIPAAGCNTRQYGSPHLPAGLSVQFLQGGVVVATAADDGQGNYCAIIPADATGTAATTLRMTTTDPRWTFPDTVVITSTTSCKNYYPNINGGQGNGLSPAIYSFVPASGYHCSCLYCWEPLKDTLNLTDAKLGSCTLTYDATLFGGLGGWSGSLTFNYAGCAKPMPLGKCPPQAGVLVTYYLSAGNGQQCQLSITYTVRNPEDEFGNPIPPSGGLGPGVYCPGPPPGIGTRTYSNSTSRQQAACPPGFLLTYQADPDPSCQDGLYADGTCHDQGTTITVTE